MAEEPLPLPIEIAWKLASTTQPLASGVPEETSLSLFFFEPDEELLTSEFPDDRLVFVKVTVTISPASFPAKLSRLAATFLGEGIPCLHMLLDLNVRNAAGDFGTIRPYFHAAAPMARRMVQTGVVGADAYEGEAEAMAIGKSGSQINETLRSHSDTTSASASAGFDFGIFSIGGSARTTTTDVTSDRAVSQVVDTTNRNASEERRELTSHTTRVENIISLLNCKYVGTPYLTFSLSPQPLQQLSIDPSDPNLWFQQLLARRSSGIEGVQEFTAVVVVPKGTDFCINARLRRVCLLDSPPGPLAFEERFNGNLLQLFRLVQYLNRTFPVGTPLEELDIDITDGLPKTEVVTVQIGPFSSTVTKTLTFTRPVVELWGLRLGEGLVVAAVVSPSAQLGVTQRGSANYKHMLEIWLDTLRDEFERETARSPLERGVLVGENRFLDTCFAQNEEGGPLTVTSSNANVSPLFRLEVPFGTVDVGGVKTLSVSASTRSRAIETTTRWNALEKHLATVLANRIELPQKPLAVNDPKVLSVLIDTWSKLSPDDERNLSFDQAATALHLNDAQRRQFKAAGASDLRGIAAALKAAPELEQHDAEVDRIRALFKERQVDATPPDLIKFSISSKASQDITRGIGSGLAKNPDRGLNG
jgi:hypothetical protein